MIAALALALSLAPLQEAAGRPTGQTVEASRLVDHDYAFALEAPTGWTVLDEEAVLAVSPDAIAGLAGVRDDRVGTFVLVIVEPLPGEMTLQGFADLCCAGLSTGLERIDDGEAEVAGLEARRVVHEGTVDGFSIRFEHTFFLRDGLGYQLVAGGMPRAGLDETFEEVRAAFTLQPGPARVRLADLSTPDQRGVDWEVRGGVYRNEPLAVGASSPEGWRLIVGYELALMSQESLVGLARGDEGVYMLLDAYRVRGVDEAAYARGLHDSVWGSLGVTAPRPLEGVERPEGRLTEVGVDQDAGMTYVLETWFEGDVVLEATAWMLGMDAALADEMLPALDAVERLSATERAALAARLDAAPSDSRAPFDATEVGPAATLRGGTLRQFDLGVVLAVPSAPRWIVAIGDAARDVHGDATIAALHSRDLGVWVKVEVDVLGDPDADIDAMHGVALDWETDGFEVLELGEVASAQVAGIDARRSSFSYVLDGGRGRAELWTVVDSEGSRGLWVTARGYEANLERAQPALEALVGGLQLRAAPMPRALSFEGAWLDQAFGYSVDPRRAPLPDGNRPPTFRDITPDEAQGRSAILEADTDEGTFLMMAVAVPPTGRADEFLHTVMERVQPEHIDDHLLEGEGIVEPVTFAGQPGTLRRQGGGPRGADFLVTVRGGIAFGLLAVGTVEQRERFARWVSLDALPSQR